MRKPEYLSYSAFKMFEKDPVAYYIKYITPKKQPRESQNHYMAIGSAFDAFVKAELHKRFIDDGDPRFETQALFEEQVEEQCREKAWTDGQILYAHYKKNGAFAELVKDMEGCLNPEFESSITGTLPGGCVLLGKPDIKYFHRSGARVIHDWKCTGFYSAKKPSPKASYLMRFPGKSMHKKCAPFYHQGILINSHFPMNICCAEWAEQLSMYAWLLGEPVGSDFVLTVDQVIIEDAYRFSALVNADWQHQLHSRITRAWEAIQAGHIFVDLPYEQSVGRCQAIDAGLTVDDTLVHYMTNRER